MELRDEYTAISLFRVLEIQSRTHYITVPAITRVTMYEVDFEPKYEAHLHNFSVEVNKLETM